MYFPQYKYMTFMYSYHNTENDDDFIQNESKWSDCDNEKL